MPKKPRPPSIVARERAAAKRIHEIAEKILACEHETKTEHAAPIGGRFNPVCPVCRASVGSAAPALLLHRSRRARLDAKNKRKLGLEERP